LQLKESLLNPPIKSKFGVSPLKEAFQAAFSLATAWKCTSDTSGFPALHVKPQLLKSSHTKTMFGRIGVGHIIEYGKNKILPILGFILMASEIFINPSSQILLPARLICCNESESTIPCKFLTIK
jgi:hypothetical protein